REERANARARPNRKGSLAAIPRRAARRNNEGGRSVEHVCAHPARDLRAIRCGKGAWIELIATQGTCHRERGDRDDKLARPFRLVHERVPLEPASDNLEIVGEASEHAYRSRAKGEGGRRRIEC